MLQTDWSDVRAFYKCRRPDLTHDPLSNLSIKPSCCPTSWLICCKQIVGSDIHLATESGQCVMQWDVIDFVCALLRVIQWINTIFVVENNVLLNNLVMCWQYLETRYSYAFRVIGSVTMGVGLVSKTSPTTFLEKKLHIWKIIYLYDDVMFMMMVLGMTLNCNHIFIVTGSFLHWCFMRPPDSVSSYVVVFFYESWSYFI